MAKKVYVTVPIYYASGNPHIGHAYTTILADTFSGYNKLMGNQVQFTAGMDEHGQKIYEKAISAKLEPQVFVDQIYKNFDQLWKKLNIDYTLFIRTTDKKHEKVIQDVFSSLLKNNYLYQGEWTGLYCVQCEENYALSDTYVKDGIRYCKVGHPITEKKEATYFLKLSKFQTWIEQYYQSHPHFISPISRSKELINNFIKPGIEDLSITRTKISWGVPTKEDPNHVLYVWIDALMCYLTAMGYGQKDDHIYQEFWKDENTDIVHVIGKEITRFHGIYWPIILKCLNVRLPNRLISHGWIVTKEGKMSKSLGNVVDPNQYIDQYGSDALRYYLTKVIPIDNDGVFAHEHFIETFNADLANNYGNFVSRSLGMINKYANGIIPKCETKLDESSLAISKATDDLLKELPQLVHDFQFITLIEKIMNLASMGNKYIEDTKPWNLVKENKTKELNLFLNVVMSLAVNLSVLLSPILKTGTLMALKQLNINLKDVKLDQLSNLTRYQNHKVNTSTPIYLRLTK
ncbi:MAG: methionine--tRNA ligase [Mycoplasma sp.]